MWLPKRRLLFIHIPKCAGTSIELFFTGQDGAHAGAHKHVTAQEAYDAVKPYGQEAWDSVFKFSVVRNPWARFLSYFNLVKTAEPDIVFDDWIRRVCSPEGLTFRGLPVHRSMTEYLAGPDGKLLVDFVGKVETLGQDFPVILQKLGEPVDLLPRALVLSYDKDYRKWYTPETRDLVGRRFREDVERFGYDY